MTPRTYRPPPLGVLDFAGRAGVVIEVTPGHFVEVILEIRHGDPDDLAQLNLGRAGYEAVYDAAWIDPMRWEARGPLRADIHLIGRVISRQEADRPRWAQDATEIEARKAIEP